MPHKDPRLIDLLTQAVELQQKQWNLALMIESYITNNNGLTDAQTADMNEAIRVLASAGDFHQVSPDEAEYFLREVAKTGAIVRKPTVSVPPLAYDEFAVQYGAAKNANGEYVDTEILTAAYAIYCENPAAHFLHQGQS